MLIFWFMCAVCAGLIGASKGEGILSFITGIVFGPFGIIFAILSSGNRVKCPACMSYVERNANLCPHCRTPQPLQERSRWARIGGDPPQ